MSEKTIYSTIVVGLGRIGLGYDLASASDEVFSHTKALLRHPSFTLIAGVDKHVDRRKDFSSFTGLQAYQSCQEALEKSQTVDICVVATPSKDRMNAIREALQLEPRFLVLEKPLALTLEEGREIVDLIRQRKIGAYVNYIRRADPAVLALSSLFEGIAQ
jgi:predicted dehydrogenase